MDNILIRKNFFSNNYPKYLKYKIFGIKFNLYKIFTES